MAQSGAPGDMNIEDQRGTFQAFLNITLWSCGLIAQAVALLTFAFAIGAGWWPGLFAFVAIGVGLGLFFRMSSTYWAVQIVLWVLLGLGGLIVPAVSGMMG